MPQMSPMDWFMLMVYFFFIYFILMIILYFVKFNKVKVIFFNKMEGYNIKWY